MASVDDIAFGQSLVYALQLGLATVFLLSSIPKLLRPQGFIKTVVNYEILSPRLSRAAAPGLIALEVGLAASFLTGLAAKAAAVAAVAMLIGFTAGVGVNLHRGRHIPCGCFGAEGPPLSIGTLVRVLALLALAIVIAALWLTDAASVTTVSNLADYGASGLRYAVDVAGITGVCVVAGTFLSALPELRHVRRLQPQAMKGSPR